MRLAALQRRRTEHLARGAAILAAAEREERDLTEADEREATELRTNVERLDREITFARFVAEADRQAPGTPINGDGDARWNDLMRGYSLRRAVAQFLPVAMTAGLDFGREREVQTEMERRGYRAAQGGGILVPLDVMRVERRDITPTTPAGGPGSNLIGTNLLADQYIDLLRAALILPRIGARTLSGLVGNVAIPGGKKSAVANWFTDGQAIGESDAEFRQVAMSPKFVGALTAWSITMTLQSTPDIEMLARADLAAVLAEAVDKAALIGSGAGAEPRGVVNQPGVIDVPIGALTWTKVLAIIAAIETKNSTMTGWAASPTFVQVARATERFPGTNGEAIMEGPAQLAGYPLVSSTNVPNNVGVAPGTNTLIAGNWPDLIIGYWGALTLLANPYLAGQYEKGGVSLRAIMACDVAVRHGESFAKADDVNGPAAP